MKLVAANPCPRHEPGASTQALPQNCARCAVRETAVCTALSGPELERLSAISISRQFASGETLFCAEDSVAVVGTVVRGTIKTYKLLADGRQQIVGFLFPGDFVGSPTQETHHVFAEALTPVELCVSSFSALQRLIRELPNLEHRLLAVAHANLDLAQDWMLLLGRKTARERLATFLLLLANKASIRGAAARVLELPMNRGEIADYLGLTIETVSRQFSKLKKAGLIQLDDSHAVTILHSDRLAEIAEGTA